MKIHKRSCPGRSSQLLLGVGHSQPQRMPKGAQGWGGMNARDKWSSHQLQGTSPARLPSGGGHELQVPSRSISEKPTRVPLQRTFRGQHLLGSESAKQRLLGKTADTPCLMAQARKQRWRQGMRAEDTHNTHTHKTLLLLPPSETGQASATQKKLQRVYDYLSYY